MQKKKTKEKSSKSGLTILNKFSVYYAYIYNAGFVFMSISPNRFFYSKVNLVEKCQLLFQLVNTSVCLKIDILFSLIGWSRRDLRGSLLAGEFNHQLMIT